MNEPRPHLEPSLWRTCRVLANPARLACLRTVIAHPSSTVEQVANGCAISEVRASLHLRALQARGLLVPVRRVRWVHYHAAADGDVAHAAPLLAALRNHLDAETESFAALVHTLTALTHPRRVEICKALRRKPLTTEQLHAETNISAPALSRHLSKLARRSFAARSAEDVWTLSPARTPLHAVLLGSLEI